MSKEEKEKEMARRREERKAVSHFSHSLGSQLKLCSEDCGHERAKEEQSMNLRWHLFLSANTAYHYTYIVSRLDDSHRYHYRSESLRSTLVLRVLTKQWYKTYD